MENEDQRAPLPDAARRAQARTDPGGPLLDVALALATGAAAAASLLDASLRHPALGLGLCGVPLVTRVAWFPAVRHRARGIGLAVLAGVALAAGRTSPSPSRDAQGWSPRASVLPGDGHAPVSLAPDGLGERHRARSSHDRAGGFAGEVPVSLRVDPGALATAAGPARRTRLGRVVERLRQRARERLEERAPATHGLGPALLLGATDAVPWGVRERFTRTGTRHLLALSGLHLGLLAAGLAVPLARAGSGRWWAPLGLGVACVVLLAATALGGRGASLQRAAVTALAALLLPLRARPGRPVPRPDGWAVLGLALAWQVLAEPGSVHAVGTQLTFTATAGLLRGAARPVGRRRAAPERRLRFGLQLAGDLVAAGARAGWGASVASLPVTWTVFGEVAPVGLLLTPLAIPLVAAIVLLAGILTLVPTASSPAGAVDLSLLDSSTGHLAELLAGSLAAVEELLLDLLALGDALPLSPLVLPHRPLGLLLLLALLGPGLARAAAPRLGWLLLAGLLAPSRPRAPHLTIEALAVGHGTAVLVETPDLGAWVFDCGSSDRTAPGRAMARALASVETGSTGLVVSHGDSDHSGGLPVLTQRVEVRLRAGWPGQGPDARTGTALLAQGPRTRLTLLRGAQLEDNEGSRSLLIECDGRRVLLSGDATERGLAGILAGVPELDLLLLPHHGASGTWVAELLARTRPSLAWASRANAAPAVAACTAAGVPLRTTAPGPLRISLPPLHPARGASTLAPP